MGPKGDAETSPGGAKEGFVVSEVRVGEWPGPELRKDKRVPLHVPIECRSQQTVVAGMAENISMSGLLVRSARTFAEDDVIAVSFALPGSSQPIRSQAQIAHVVPDVFMGLELLGLPEDSRARIENFIASVPVPAGKPK